MMMRKFNIEMEQQIKPKLRILDFSGIPIIPMGYY
jgi:hypothetical protein